MIPANQFLPEPIVAPFQAPEDAQTSFTTQVVRGGVAINDASQGRDVQDWKATLSDGMVDLAPEGASTAWSHPTPGATQVSVAFDNNMNPVLAWQDAAGSHLYFYGTLEQAYTQRDFPNTTSCKVALDDRRQVTQAASDVLFAYTRDGALYWRQQRDRYEIERLIGETEGKIVRMGMSEDMRMQFECRTDI